MKRIEWRVLATALALVPGAVAWSQEGLPPAEPPYARVRYEPSTTPGELAFGVSYTVWLPPGVQTLRGVIVHQHGCGEGACRAGQTAAYDLHWQALAQKHHCALMGPSYEQPETANCQLWCDPRNGSEKRFLQALDDLATKTGHPELATAPWALWGHSGGGTWAGTMLMRDPGRIAAVWLRSGTPNLVPREGSTLPPLQIPDAARAVPVMCNLGTREGVTVKDDRFGGVWDRTRAFFEELRSQGGLVGVAVDPNSSHDCGNSRYLAIPWFDACLTARLPRDSGNTLLPMPTDPVWLAPLLGDTAQPASQYRGDPRAAIWLPDQRIALAWAQYTQDGNVPDDTPPPAPTDVRSSADGVLRWNAQADLESGLSAFIIERDGVEVGRVPAEPAGSVGRQVFQRTSYSDTPTPPLALMRFTDPTAQPGTTPTYTVWSLNGVGTRSQPASVRPSALSPPRSGTP